VRKSLLEIQSLLIRFLFYDEVASENPFYVQTNFCSEAYHKPHSIEFAIVEIRAGGSVAELKFVTGV
jgi:hypothetical protein